MRLMRSTLIIDEEVIRAAQTAGVHDLILHLPNGYDSPIGQAGRGLFADQAQRVGLARAMHGEPSMIILDDPNSALDSEGEAARSRAIAAAKLRGAAVAIAHRAGILATADRLVVLNEGNVERDGERQAVLAELQACGSSERREHEGKSLI